MAKKWKDLKDKMSPEARARVEARVKASMTEMPLHKLRQAMKMSQAQLAETLGITQSEVSRMEHRTDMYLSTLRRLIEAMGGDLEIVARMPDGNVRISSFDQIEDRELVEA